MKKGGGGGQRWKGGEVEGVKEWKEGGRMEVWKGGKMEEWTDGGIERRNDEEMKGRWTNGRGIEGKRKGVMKGVLTTVLIPSSLTDTAATRLKMIYSPALSHGCE